MERFERLEKRVRELEEGLRDGARRGPFPGPMPGAGDLEQMMRRLENYDKQLQTWREQLEKSLREQFGEGQQKEFWERFPKLRELPKGPGVEELREQMKKLFGEGRPMRPERGNRENSRPQPRLYERLPEVPGLDGLGLEDLGRMEGMIPGADAIRDVIAGLRKLNSIMTQEDWARVADAVKKLSTELKAEDLQDQRQLLRKLEGVLEPKDLERMLEIVSDFLETEEGQVFEARVEKLIASMEEFMASEQGKRVMEGLKKLAERLQGMDRESLQRFEKLFGRPGSSRELLKAREPSLY